MLGLEVVAAAERAGHEVDARTRADLDVSDRDAVRAAIEATKPPIVINCAAWTDVDGAEASEPRATAVNGAGAGHLAEAAATVGARLLHVSTDYVFAGDKGSPYVESDPTGPRSAYGRSKLAGELAVAAHGPADHLIVRTSWLFGPHGHNFVATMLRLGRERDVVTVVDDQVGCPTFAGHLASALVGLAEGQTRGLLHLAGAGACSWHDFAQEIFRQAGVPCLVERGRTADLGRPAPRPAYSVLESERADAPALPPWREGLAAYLALSEVSA